ncbi:MAG: NIPSNAP family protein [Bacteroidetes bacterium]|nr:NIPSNAP family protein [Bacteroidota bacterium]
MKAVNTFFGIITILILLSQSNGMTQQLGDKVYWMSIIEVSVGKLESYHAFNSRELLPLMEENGYTTIAVWQTIVGNIEEVIFVSEFENMEAYHKARVSLLSSIDWQTVSKKLDSLTKSIHTRLLSTAPF